ncbi:lipoprotein [Marinomonas ostreistagni]|nr:lipoprotein [Marinomonas ostreistagni]
MLKPFFVVFFALVLSACGNKGPLYLPDQPTAEETATTTNQN